MSTDHHDAAPRHEAARDPPHAAEPDSPRADTPFAPPLPTVSRLLADPALRARGNDPQRQAAILHLQRTQGNRATRRLLQRMSAARPTPAAPAPLQREADPIPPTDAPDTPGGSAAGPQNLIVDDDATDLAPGQLHRGDFLAQLRPAVAAAVTEALTGTPMAALAGPALDRYFASYASQGSQALERSIHQEVPGAAGVGSAGAYIPLIVARVRQELPAVAAGSDGTNPAAGAPGGAPDGGDGGAGPSLLAQGSGLISQITTALFKARDGGGQSSADVPAGPAPLGAGQPLPGALRSGMEAAYGADFSQVAIHTEAPAAALADQWNARAFTVGQRVAFGAGEYQPGTLPGDALIAHELAHVVQQRGSPAPAEPQTKGPADVGALEEDADRAAVGAILQTWGHVLGNVRTLGAQALPRLRSGLRLARCTRTVNPTGEQYDQGATSFGSATPTMTGANTDRSATREEILQDLTTMNAGGTFVFFGHSASDRQSHEVVGINPAGGGHTVTGKDLAERLRRDRNPPTMVVLGACGSAALLPSVLSGGVPVAVGLSENAANVKVAAAVDAFMDALNGGKTFAEAKQAADDVLSQALLDMPGELVIRLADGYDLTMTLAAARSRHQADPAGALPE